MDNTSTGKASQETINTIYKNLVACSELYLKSVNIVFLDPSLDHVHQGYSRMVEASNVVGQGTVGYKERMRINAKLAQAASSVELAHRGLHVGTDRVNQISGKVTDEAAIKELASRLRRLAGDLEGLLPKPAATLAEKEKIETEGQPKASKSILRKK